MAHRLIRKVLVPASALLVVGLGLAGLGFSIFAESRLREDAKANSAAQVATLELVLDSTESLLGGQVRGAMKVFRAEAGRQGAPGAGRLVKVANLDVPDLGLGNSGQANRFDMVDAVAERTGATATLFTKGPGEFVRISTNVKKADGSRAIGTTLDLKGKAHSALVEGKPFYGLVDILGSPYSTGYEPIFNPQGNVIGAFYVGYKISNLDRLATHIRKSRVALSGFTALLDQKDSLLFAPDHLPAAQVLSVIKDGRLEGQPWRVERRAFPAWGFTILAAYPEADIAKSIWALRVGVIFCIVVMALAISLLLYRIVQRRLLRPVQHILEGVLRKDLTYEITGLADDEIGELGRGFNDSLLEFRTIFRSLASGAEQVASGSTELSATSEEMQRTSDEIAKVAERQHKGMQEVTRSMSALTQIIGGVEQRVVASQKHSSHAESVSKKGSERGGEAVKAMEAIRLSTSRMAQMVGVVQDMARQTNLLSLNAAIEAAKAGEHGKGFAVVADEVRKLAERSGQSSREIRSLIEEVDTVVSSGTLAVSDTTEALDETQRTVHALVGTLGEIAEAMGEQLTTRDEVDRQVEGTNLDIERGASASLELSATVSEVARTAVSLSEVAEDLASKVRAYKI